MEEIEFEYNSPTPGYCLVSNEVIQDGKDVKYMFREEPLEKGEDSGWRFFSGEEEQSYVDDDANIQLINIDFVVNKDLSLLPYMKLPFPIELERDSVDDPFLKIEE